MKIAIVGAGITGLTAAYRLAKAGHEVTVFEKEKFTGGLASAIDFSGAKLDRIYRHIFKSDLHFVKLVDELGLTDRFTWIESKMGWFDGKKLYPFTTPLHVLSFSPLPFIDRLKLGLMTVYLARVNDWKKYEKITARDWIIKYAGRKVYDTVWGALLNQKFGSRAGDIAMTWLYGRIHARIASRVSKELLGYMNGSFQVLIDRLEAEIKSAGGKILTSTAVNKVLVESGKAYGLSAGGAEIRFDSVLVTAAPELLSKMAEFPADYAERLKKLEYFGSIVMVMSMKNSITPYYWLNMAAPDSPFVAVIEHTNFIGPENYSGNRIAYLGKYLPVTDPLYKKPDSEIKQVFFSYLKKSFPSFDESGVIEWKVTREPYSQPIVPLEYSKIKIDYSSPVKGL
ncbi:MAG TPA: NAD(P)/FAD-dependent oxidoreductase, partial [Candidatus Goldiibacteriota bacterium]|nr:NAD(P)/FAD-dependent oxidoreductase [Candidatus Goldiibacteriota bacterium]